MSTKILAYISFIMVNSVIINTSFAEQPALLTEQQLKQVKQVRQAALKSNLGYEIL